MKSTGHAWSSKAWCSAVISCYSTALIGAFRSLLFTQWFAPSAVRCCTALLLLCFLIVGIYASEISIPLSLLMLLGWSLIWIASLIDPKTSSMQSKRRDLHHKWLHRETNEKTELLLAFTTMNNHNIFYEIFTFRC